MSAIVLYYGDSITLAAPTERVIDMSDGFEERTGVEDLPSDYGFVPEEGYERAPGNGWESEPVQDNGQITLNWRDYFRIAFLRLTGR
jgi:hypothetical protein